MGKTEKKTLPVLLLTAFMMLILALFPAMAFAEGRRRTISSRPNIPR